MAAHLGHSIEELEGVPILKLDGHLDAIRIAADAESLPLAAQALGARLILELSGLVWIDSAGVGILISICRRARARGGDVKIAGLRGQPKDVFHLLRLEQALELFASVREAAEALSAARR